jgi:hypothetical protein
MMELACPHCAETMRVPERCLGVTGLCNFCGDRIKICGDGPENAHAVPRSSIITGLKGAMAERVREQAPGVLDKDLALFKLVTHFGEAANAHLNEDGEALSESGRAAIEGLSVWCGGGSFAVADGEGTPFYELGDLFSDDPEWLGAISEEEYLDALQLAQELKVF